MTLVVTQFVSECMKEVTRLLGIKELTTTPYHPMCNGLTEKFNGNMKIMLKRLCSKQPRQWHRYINPLLFAYHEAGTPSFRKPRTKASITTTVRLKSGNLYQEIKC